MSEDYVLVPAIYATSKDPVWSRNGAIVFSRSWGNNINYKKCFLKIPSVYDPEIITSLGGKCLRLSAAGFGLSDGSDDYLPVFREGKIKYAYFRCGGKEKVIFEIIFP